MMFAIFYAHQRKSWHETTLAVKNILLDRVFPINFVWNKVWEKAIQLGISIY